MKSFWINSLDISQYAEGDKPYGDYWVEVSQRIDSTYDWDGQNWMQSAEKLATQEELTKPQPSMKELVAALPADIQAKLQTKVATNVSAPIQS